MKWFLIGSFRHPIVEVFLLISRSGKKDGRSAEGGADQIWKTVRIPVNPISIDSKSDQHCDEQRLSSE
jgi:hypothetical protein